MRQIVPTLWFNDQAEEAVDLYASIFDTVKSLRTDYYTNAGKEIHGHEPGSVLTVEFEIEGQTFIALNGGPHFTFNPSISFLVRCSTADEVNRLWEKFLSNGATELMSLGIYPFSEYYGWLQDKYGVSWQLGVSPGQITQKIVTSLLFVNKQYGKAEEAMKFYTSVFPESRVGEISRYPADINANQAGSVMYGEFTIMGQQFTAMDSAQEYTFDFNEAISLVVTCKDQAEVDMYWERLSAVPEAEQCGWLKDKFGVSWQIVPEAMNNMLMNGTPEQVERVTDSFMRMKKIDIAELEQAYQSV